jgi:hypothetical protein
MQERVYVMKEKVGAPIVLRKPLGILHWAVTA